MGLPSLMKKCLLVTLLLFPLWAMALSVTAHVDDSTIAMGDSLTYTITAKGALPDFVPDFSALGQSFTILTSSRNQLIENVNGKNTQQSQWVLVLSPKHRGTLTIPAIAVKGTNTRPITVTVTKASNVASNGALKPVFMKAEVDNQAPYIQGQVIYTVRIYYEVNVENAQISSPMGQDMSIKPLAGSRRYEKMLGGKRYQVMEKQFVIFPQKAGRLNITPPVLSGDVPFKTRNQYFTSTNWRGIRISGNSIALQVKLIPASNDNHWWLPASRVTVAEQWSKPLHNWHAGEPITRTVTVQAAGQLGNQLPPIGPKQFSNAQAYPDQPVLKTVHGSDGVIGTRIEKVSLIPNHEGKLSIPAVNIAWFNTRTGRMETASLPAKTINILRGTGPAATAPNAPQSNITTASSSTAPSNSSPWWHNAWLWTALSFALLWVATLLFWRRHRGTPSQSQHPDTTDTALSISKAKHHFRSACKGKDPTQIRAALLAYGQALFPAEQILTLGDIIKHIHHEELITLLQTFDRSFYHSDTPCDLKALYPLVMEHLAPPKSASSDSQNGLADLYLQ